MDFYIWIMERLGLATSDIGYFLYCDGDRFTEDKFLHPNSATMQFKVTLIEYKSDMSWIEPTLLDIKKLLNAEECPDHAGQCEHGNFLRACGKVS